ncbi:DNA polymerase zeta catalytic subunit-like isoform X2 [Varroa jacobsoni]|uniref:DNA polymerase zeta catalytic subunit-like isoform X2 n=1 Tax=Varroa jacobsoni TaxID=62625 RepID=UPI000BF70C68|nr:DNA polymerase zeta catalytic subunit-like isoform X2 [Varroa jacobsoni]
MTSVTQTSLGVLSCSVLIVDSYQTDPVPGLDETFASATKTQLHKVPVLRVFGIDVENKGRKVCVHIHRVYPYLCIAMGSDVPDDRRKNTFVEALEKALNEHAKVARHRVVEATFFKGRKFYGYHADEEVFLQIAFSDPRTIKRASEVITSGQVGSPMPVFEAHIPFNLQFMIDNQIQGMNLLHIGKCQFRINSEKPTGSASSTLTKQTCCQVEVDCVIEDILNQVEEVEMNPGLQAIWQDPRLSEVAQLDTTIIQRVIVPSERELSYRKLLWKFLGIPIEEQENLAEGIKNESFDAPDKAEHEIDAKKGLSQESQVKFQDTLLDAAADLLNGEADSVLFQGPSADDDESYERESAEMSQIISEDILQDTNSLEDSSVSEKTPVSTLFSDTESTHTENSTQSFLAELAAMREDTEGSPVRHEQQVQIQSDSSVIFSDEETLIEVPASDEESVKEEVKTKEPSICGKIEQPSTSGISHLTTSTAPPSASLRQSETALVKLIDNDVSSDEEAMVGNITIATINEDQETPTRSPKRWDVLKDLPQKKHSAAVEEILQWLRRKKSRTFGNTEGTKPDQTISQHSSNDTLTQDLRFAYSFGGTPETTERYYEMITSLVCEVHCATRGNLKPDPAFDRILAVIFALHKDFPGESDVIQIKIIYDGCVSDTALRRSLLAEIGIVNSVELFRCSSEINLIMKLTEQLAKWDPDIILGYETDTLSWGFLIERCLALQMNPKLLLSRVAVEVSTEESACQPQAQPPELTAGVRFDSDKERYFESWEYRLTGRVLLNVWRILRKELSLTSYSFENVYFHILHRRESRIAWRTLREWYEDELLASRSLAYYVKRCVGCLEMLSKLEIYTKTCEMARIYGIQFYEVLSRGSQFRVESMMLRSTRRDGFIALSPTVLDRNLQRSMEWIPLVMEPHSNFYTDPVVVLDFQSLYPSVMIAYNYCFSTCFGKVQDIVKGTQSIKFGCSDLLVDKNKLLQLKDDLIISPSGSIFAKHHIRKGILPQLVEEILNTRIMVKKGMKKCKSKSFHRILDARQLGLKSIANVTYGYTAAGYSGRMPLVELADSIVSKGKESLETAIKIVNTTPEWGADVLYGDTDSMFILLRGRDKAEAFRIGRDIADRVSAMFPDPMKLKFEKVYLPCILETKKRYFGYMFESEDQNEPVLDAKGIELVRRDGCKAQQVILDKAIKTLFDTKNFDAVKKTVQKSFELMLKGHFGLHRYIFAKEYNGAKYYQKNSCVPVLKVARLLKMDDPRAEPLVGERVPYIVTQGWDKSRIIDLVSHPDRLIQDCRLRPNITYYILRVVCPALDRALLKVRTAEWYHQLPKNLRVPSSKEGVKKTMVHEYFDVNRCIICDRSEPCVNRICEGCQSDSQRAVYVSQSKMRDLEDDFNRILAICQGCTGRQDIENCISLDCPIFFRRINLRHRLEAVEQLKLVQYMF